MGILKHDKFKIKLINIILLILVGYNFLFLNIDNQRVFRFTDEFHTGLNCTDDDLKNVKYLKNLKFLSIASTDITNIDFVCDFSTIQKLYIAPVNVNMDLSSISKCHNLETLYLFGADLGNISFIDGNSKLKRLDLGFCRINDISGISQLKNLESVSLTNDISNSIVGIDELKQLPNLTHITLGNANSSDISIIKDCENLKSLSLIDSRQIIDLKQISNLKNLENLFIPSLDIENQDTLLKFGSLKEITVSKDKIDSDIVNKLWSNGVSINLMQSKNSST